MRPGHESLASRLLHSAETHESEFVRRICGSDPHHMYGAKMHCNSVQRFLQEMLSAFGLYVHVIILL